MNNKKKSNYEKKPKGKLFREPDTEAQRAIKALRYEGIGINDPHDRIFRSAIKHHYAEVE